MKNTSKGFIIPLLIVIVAILLAGGGAYFYTNSERTLWEKGTPDSMNKDAVLPQATSTMPTTNQTTTKAELFIASNLSKTEGKLVAKAWNLSSNKEEFSKEIPNTDWLGGGGAGADNNVQYNSKTQEIFFYTNPYSDSDTCQNKDGTCLFRIYKVTKNQTKPEIVFESDKGIVNWMVNSSDNSILVFLNSGMLEKISSENSKVIFAKDYKSVRGAYEESERFILSGDGKYTYQILVIRSGGSRTLDPSVTTNLKIMTINNTDGGISYNEVFFPRPVLLGSPTFSPDERYIAVDSLNDDRTYQLYLYDLINKKLTETSFHRDLYNVSLYWSTDSSKILTFPEDPVSRKHMPTFFDVATMKDLPISNFPGDFNTVTVFGLAGNSIVYAEPNGKVNAFDIKKNIVTDLNLVNVTALSPI